MQSRDMRRANAGSQALDVAPVALYDIDEVVHVTVFPEQHLCVVNLVLLRTVSSAEDHLQSGLALTEAEDDKSVGRQHHRKAISKGQLGISC